MMTDECGCVRKQSMSRSTFRAVVDWGARSQHSCVADGQHANPDEIRHTGRNGLLMR